MHVVSQLKSRWPIILGYLFSAVLMEEEVMHKLGAGHRRLGGHYP